MSLPRMHFKAGKIENPKEKKPRKHEVRSLSARCLGILWKLDLLEEKKQSILVQGMRLDQRCTKWIL